jgi:uncharacterized surface protein with fasciclin (FAS1) repeats
MKSIAKIVLVVLALVSVNAVSVKAQAHPRDSAAKSQAKAIRYVKLRCAADIVDTAVAAGSFTTLVAAVKAAGLVDTLKGAGPFTVFAPTDEAFAKLPAGTVETLLKPENKAKLVKLLTYHVVAGNVSSAEVVKLKSAKTVQGQSLKVAAGDGVRINNARVLKADIETSNGVIHVIDTVLMPK